jgi:hypothetical protein
MGNCCAMYIFDMVLYKKYINYHADYVRGGAAFSHLIICFANN